MLGRNPGQEEGGSRYNLRGKCDLRLRRRTRPVLRGLHHDSRESLRAGGVLEESSHSDHEQREGAEK